MTNERVKTLLYLLRSLTTSCQSLTTSCPLNLNFFYEQTQEARTRVQASNNFQFSAQNCPIVELLSRETRRIDFKTASSLAVYMFEWFLQQPTSTFLHSHLAMRKLNYSMQDLQKPFSEFQQTAAVETCDKFRYKSFLKPCLYSTWLTYVH